MKRIQGYLSDVRYLNSEYIVCRVLQILAQNGDRSPAKKNNC